MNYQPLTKDGKILMLALDHRGSLEKMLPAAMPPDQKKHMMVNIKKSLIAAFSQYNSGVLLDPPIGLTAYKELTSQGQVLKPYLLCIEKTGYTDTDHERVTVLEYSVAQLKGLGASGVKLLLFYHPDGKTAPAQRALAKKVLEDCKRENLPLFLELLNYSLDGNPYDPSLLVPRSVKDFIADGVNADVFKLEFPGNAVACDEVTTSLGATPWILLTKGETYEKFVAGLKVAVQHGAKGFLAGRAIWQDFTTVPEGEWEHFFQTTAKDRFREITAIALT